MPKMKTVSGAKKRFRVGGSGRIKRKKAYKRHILEHKSAKRSRRLRQTAEVSKPDEAAVKLMLCI